MVACKIAHPVFDRAKLSKAVMKCLLRDVRTPAWIRLHCNTACCCSSCSCRTFTNRDKAPNPKSLLSACCQNPVCWKPIQ